MATHPKQMLIRSLEVGEAEMFIKWAEDHDDTIPLTKDQLFYFLIQCASILKSWPDCDCADDGDVNELLDQ